jgi:hypothetical protein
MNQRWPAKNRIPVGWGQLHCRGKIQKELSVGRAPGHREKGSEFRVTPWALTEQIWDSAFLALFICEVSQQGFHPHSHYFRGEEGPFCFFPKYKAFILSHFEPWLCSPPQTSGICCSLAESPGSWALDKCSPFSLLFTSCMCACICNVTCYLRIFMAIRKESAF